MLLIWTATIPTVNFRRRVDHLECKCIVTDQEIISVPMRKGTRAALQSATGHRWCHCLSNLHILICALRFENMVDTLFLARLLRRDVATISKHNAMRTIPLCLDSSCGTDAKDAKFHCGTRTSLAGRTQLDIVATCEVGNVARLRPWRSREHFTQVAEKQVLEEAAQTKTRGHVATQRLFLTHTPTMFSRVLRSPPLALPAQGLRGLICIENATGEPSGWCLLGEMLRNHAQSLKHLRNVLASEASRTPFVSPTSEKNKRTSWSSSTGRRIMAAVMKFGGCFYNMRRRFQNCD